MNLEFTAHEEFSNQLLKLNPVGREFLKIQHARSGTVIAPNVWFGSITHYKHSTAIALSFARNDSAD
jgi:hypothetical protein